MLDKAPVDCELPEIVLFAPLQLPFAGLALAVQLVGLLPVNHCRVEAPPEVTLVGFAEMETVGTEPPALTVTVQLPGVGLLGVVTETVFVPEVV